MPEDLVDQGRVPEAEGDRRALLDFIAWQSSTIYYVGDFESAGGGEVSAHRGAMIESVLLTILR